MAKAFSESVKKSIYKKLLTECEKHWAAFGYKKTNIDELCSIVGISKGAFYQFFDSKESLFCEVLDALQQRLIDFVEEILSSPPTKEDICTLLKKLYLEYDKTNILIQRYNPDFITFLNRVPDEWKEKNMVLSMDFANHTLFDSSLKLKMEKKKAIALINTLLSIMTLKHNIDYDHYEIFCTLLDSVINQIYV